MGSCIAQVVDDQNIHVDQPVNVVPQDQMVTAWRFLQKCNHLQPPREIWEKYTGNVFKAFLQAEFLRVADVGDPTLVGIDVCFELNLEVLCREIAWIFGCDPLEENERLGVDTVRFASFSDRSIPVVLMLPKSRHEFRAVITGLTSAFPGPLIIFAPSSEFHDERSIQQLRRQNAQFIDLASDSVLTTDGDLKARRPWREILATVAAQEQVAPEPPAAKLGQRLTDSGLAQHGEKPTITFGKGFREIHYPTGTLKMPKPRNRAKALEKLLKTAPGQWVNWNQLGKDSGYSDPHDGFFRAIRDANRPDVVKVIGSFVEERKMPGGGIEVRLKPTYHYERRD